MRIGVAGLNAAGKTQVVDYLARRSFYRESLSDVIRDELERDSIECTRDAMIVRGRELREGFGAAILAERVLARLPADRNHVIDSIRHPAEVAALKADGDFVLLWIDAPAETRFERARERGRVGASPTLAEFQAEQARELESENPAAQQLLAVRELADEVISNDGDLEGLRERVQAVLERRLLFRSRPDWDTYFMNIATVVASRANCVKRKVGAVVISDRRIISTGYNGTPRGARNCNEGGCPRCAGGAPSGTRLDECLCSHAEENAITQAAYHGVRVRQGAIYTTFCPCLMCTKMIINAGIIEVIYGSPFPLAEASLLLLHEAGVKVRTLGKDRGSAGTGH